eukprot:m.305528 g.305528  ORF g.305528 m.305528 type:complete len:222 (+) comp17941_c0_seq1:91-756(+)
MTKFAVLLGGPIVATPQLRSVVAGARIIAADSGVRHAAALRVVPELWIGDFDSSDEELCRQYADLPREVLNPDKDATDGELALRRALSLGARELVVIGAFGGARTDHTIVHMTMACRLAIEHVVPIVLTSGAEEALPLVPGTEMSLDLPAGTVFSIVAFSAITNIAICGGRWALDHIDVPFGSSLLVSNEAAGGPLCVSLEAGTALLMIQRIPEQDPLRRP